MHVQYKCEECGRVETVNKTIDPHLEKFLETKQELDYCIVCDVYYKTKSGMSLKAIAKCVKV